MEPLHNTAVFLVRRVDSTVIGTSFVIHHDPQGVYLLTCGHVAASIGVSPLIEASTPLEAVVIATGMERGVDLAVLHVPIAFPVTPLPLAEFNGTKATVTLHGYKRHADNHQILYRPVTAQLAAPILLRERPGLPWACGWDVMMTGHYKLADGYSGAPAVNDHGQVIGVAAIREEGGLKGQIIAVKALADCWPMLPLGLITPLDPGSATHTAPSQRPHALTNQQIIRGTELLVQSTYCQSQQRILGLFEGVELEHLRPIVPNPESGSQSERAEALIIEINRRRLRDRRPALPYLFQVLAARLKAVDVAMSSDLESFSEEIASS